MAGAVLVRESAGVPERGRRTSPRRARRRARRPAAGWGAGRRPDDRSTRTRTGSRSSGSRSRPRLRRPTWRGAAALVLLLVVLGALAAGLLAWQAGWRLYAVRTGSMTPTYPIGSVVLDAPVREPVAVGDVITFRTGDGLVTHRVAGSDAVGLKTKGDANRAVDPWTIPTDYVQGRVVGGLRGGGYALVFLQQPTGVLSLMVLTTSVVLAWSVFFGSSAGGQSDVTEVAAASSERMRRSA